jgi:hypothetical protein
VGVVQALGRLRDDEGRDVVRDLHALLLRRVHELREVEALDVLHREEQALVAVVGELVDLDDVRVIQARGEVRLVDEHRAEAARRSVRRQDALDDEELVRALGAALFREEYFGHPSGAEAAEDLEIGELRGRLGRHRNGFGSAGHAASRRKAALHGSVRPHPSGRQACASRRTF